MPILLCDILIARIRKKSYKILVHPFPAKEEKWKYEKTHIAVVVNPINSSLRLESKIALRTESDYGNEK